METKQTGRLLVVDDDPGLRDLLRRYLEQHGYQVRTANDGRSMEEVLAREEIALVILDLMLPGEDGLQLARRIRERGGPPIVMISACGEETDRIVGLEVGADDYLPKPFNPRELLARVRAVLRRAAPVEAPRNGVEFGPFRLDLSTRRLTRNQEEVALTGAEFHLLRVFVEHPGRVLTRDLLLQLLKGYDHQPYDRSIDVRVTRLRRKIEDDPGAPRYIRTLRGEGYQFSPEG